MSNFHPLTNFKKMTRDELVLLAGAVSSKYYGVLLFNNPAATPPVVPPVSKIDFDGAIKDVNDAAVNAAGGGVELTAILASKVGILITKISLLGKDVNSKANGSQLIVLSSGFACNKGTNTPRKSSIPVVNSLTNHGGGTVIADLQVDPGALGYIGGYSTTADGPITWCALSTVAKNVLMEGMTPGQEYYFAFVTYSSGVNQFSAPCARIQWRVV